MRVSIATLSLVALVAPAARAATSSTTPPTVGATASPGAGLKGPTVWGILPWGGVGIGARYMFPLDIKPLLTSGTVRDNFALEFGADLHHRSYGILGHDYGWTEVIPVGGAMWNVWLNDKFALYPKLELG